MGGNASMLRYTHTHSSTAFCCSYMVFDVQMYKLSDISVPSNGPSNCVKSKSV